MSNESHKPLDLKLWNNLQDNERSEAIVHFVDSGLKQTKENFILDLAKLINLGVLLSEVGPITKLHSLLLNLLFQGKSKMDYFKDDFLYYWLLYEKREILVTFLDAQSIPHKKEILMKIIM